MNAPDPELRRRRRARRSETEAGPTRHAQPGKRRRRKRRSGAGKRKAAARQTSVDHERQLWQVASTWPPVVGIGLVAVLLYGVVFLNDAWPARAFVLLFYGALLCTVAAYAVPRWVARRSLPPVRSWVTDIRGGLSVFVTVFVLWAWFPFLTRPFIGWCVRMVSSLRFF